jgi:hypothetical protein
MLSIRIVKLFDIGYTSTIYLLIAITLSIMIDKWLGPFDEKKEKKKSVIRRFLELAGLTWLVVIVTYMVRNIAELIPSPFHKIAGFDHYLTKELRFAAIFTFIFLFLLTHFKEKLLSFSNELMQ